MGELKAVPPLQVSEWGPTCLPTSRGHREGMYCQLLIAREICPSEGNLGCRGAPPPPKETAFLSWASFRTQSNQRGLGLNLIVPSKGAEKGRQNLTCHLTTSFVVFSCTCIDYVTVSKAVSGLEHYCLPKHFISWFIMSLFLSAYLLSFIEVTQVLHGKKGGAAMSPVLGSWRWWGC